MVENNSAYNSANKAQLITEEVKQYVQEMLYNDQENTEQANTMDQSNTTMMQTVKNLFKQQTKQREQLTKLLINMPTASPLLAQGPSKPIEECPHCGNNKHPKGDDICWVLPKNAKRRPK